MIALNTNSNEKLVATQQTTSPLIYLDNWALKNISCDTARSTQFIKIIKACNGTLAFSGMNLFELSLVTVKPQLCSLENFLNMVMPNIAFMDIIPQNVIQRENTFMNTGEKIAPHLDSNFLKVFTEIDRKSVNPLDWTGFLNHVGQNEIINMRKNFMRDHVSMVTEKREMVKADPKYKYAVSSTPKGQCLQIATRYIYQEIINFLIRTNIDMSNSNHWCDLFHTVVPIAYCNFVLLDKTWTHVASKTINRLRKSGQSAERADVFSLNEIDIFWDKLNNYRVSKSGCTEHSPKNNSGLESEY